jgi:hypothetical protein
MHLFDAETGAVPFWKKKYTPDVYSVKMGSFSRWILQVKAKAFRPLKNQSSKILVKENNLDLAIRVTQVKESSATFGFFPRHFHGLNTLNKSIT